MLEKLIAASRRMDPDTAHKVVSLSTLGVIGPRLVESGVEVSTLGMRGPWSVMGGFFRLVGELRRQPAQTIVQTWMYHGDLLGGLAAWLAGRRRLVWNVRQTGLLHNDVNRATRVVARLCGRVSGWLPVRIVCNARSAIDIHAALGYGRAPFVVLPNGFDTEVFKRRPEAGAKLRRQWGIDEGAFAFGLVARLDPQKDHDNFIAAAKLVARQLPQARFVLVGRGIASSPELAASIGAADLATQFVCLDQLEDMPAVMSALDVLCLSSRSEGFPNVLGEAMSCETPVVSTNAGDAASLVDDLARIAPVANPQALADCMLRVARLPQQDRQALGLRDRQRIIQNFGIAEVWVRYRALYTEVLRSR